MNLETLHATSLNETISKLNNIAKVFHESELAKRKSELAKRKSELATLFSFDIFSLRDVACNVSTMHRIGYLKSITIANIKLSKEFCDILSHFNLHSILCYYERLNS